jgi:hypothetical protein
MLTFTPDGRRVLVANEGEPNNYNAGNIDPEGSVSIIEIPAAGVQAITQANVRTVDFRSLNGQEAALRARGVRIFGPRATAAQDLEPEYITVQGDTAYVVCQENNAIALIRISTATLIGIRGLGLKNHNLTGFGLDPSDRDGAGGTGAINIAPRPVFGIYQPDGIAAYSVGGRTFIVTANEGDARDGYAGTNEPDIRAGAPSIRLDPAVFGDTFTHHWHSPRFIAGTPNHLACPARYHAQRTLSQLAMFWRSLFLHLPCGRRFLSACL